MPELLTQFSKLALFRQSGIETECTRNISCKWLKKASQGDSQTLSLVRNRFLYTERHKYPRQAGRTGSDSGVWRLASTQPKCK